MRDETNIREDKVFVHMGRFLAFVLIRVMDYLDGAVEPTLPECISGQCLPLSFDYVLANLTLLGKQGMAV